MATTVTEELFRVRYMIEGQQGVEVLRQSLERQKATLNQLVALYKDAGLSEQTFTNASNRLAASIARTSQEMERLNRAAGIGAGGGGGRGGGSQMGMAFMNIGYAIEDLNYGFAGLLNNLPSVAAGFGASTGLVGAVAAAGGAAYMLYRNWDGLMKLVGAGIPQPALKGLEALEANLSRINKRLEELKEKGRLTLPEFVEQNKLEEKKAVEQRKVENKRIIDDIQKVPDAERRQNVQAFDGAVQDFGGQAVVDALKKNIAKNVLGLQGNDEQKVAELIRMVREGRFDAFNEAMRLLDGTQIGQAMQENSAAGRQKRSLVNERNAFADALKEQAVEEKKKDKELSVELNAQGQQMEAEGRRGTVDEATGRVGDIRGRIRLGIRRGNTDEQLIGRITEVLKGQDADPVFAKRRAEEMVKEERRAAARDGEGALSRIPGVESEMRRRIIMGGLMTGDPQKAADNAAESLAKELQKMGIEPDEARFQGFQLAEKVQLGLREDAMAGRLGRPTDAVQTFGATEWVRSVQDGQNVAKDQLQVLRSIDAHIENAARGRGLFLS